MEASTAIYTQLYNMQTAVPVCWSAAYLSAAPVLKHHYTHGGFGNTTLYDGLCMFALDAGRALHRVTEVGIGKDGVRGGGGGSPPYYPALFYRAFGVTIESHILEICDICGFVCDVTNNHKAYLQKHINGFGDRGEGAVPLEGILWQIVGMLIEKTVGIQEAF
jgi:hypothetical protein